MPTGEALQQPLVWMDLEMTGLDPERDRILEVAVVLTDGSLRRQESGPDLVLHQAPELLGAMDAWNSEHHGASGLLDRVRAETRDEARAEQEILEFLGRWIEPGTAPLAGNSVHQDRAFLRRWMPALHGFLHYRNVDVSTLKELARRWAPGVLESAPAKQGHHRALEDIQESIRELEHYRASLGPPWAETTDPRFT